MAIKTSNDSPDWGGARKGSGRPKLGRKQRHINMDDKEFLLAKRLLAFHRGKIANFSWECFDCSERENCKVYCSPNGNQPNKLYE